MDRNTLYTRLWLIWVVVVLVGCLVLLAMREGFLSWRPLTEEMHSIGPRKTAPF
jgi:hypothetical protein